MRLLIAAAAVATVAGAVTFTAPRAEAMTLPGIAAAPKAAEEVALVCRRVWNGYRWERICRETGPRYYAPGYYDPPRPRYYAPPRPRYYGGGGYY